VMSKCRSRQLDKGANVSCVRATSRTVAYERYEVGKVHGNRSAAIVCLIAIITAWRRTTHTNVFDHAYISSK
jgi:hypothetical protein